MKTVDLRSDTVTRPSPEMREVMMSAEVGDDVFGEDPTINRLQEMIAELTGMEAALFVTSGTQGNQISLNAHTQPGDEVVVERECHIINYECGAPAMLAGVQLYPVEGERGILTAEQVAAAVRPEDVHLPHTGLICLENTHNRAGGSIYPIEEIRKISEIARSKNIPLHLDGARLWNASAETGISIKEYCQYFDSVSMCFSKGLGAPVGSIVAGSKEFIGKAHQYRKAYGGGMRQAGILAAAAIYAVEHNFPLLKEDHRRIRRLAGAISELPGVSVDLDSVQTNILIFRVAPQKMDADELVARLQENGVLMFKIKPEHIRAVSHIEISDDDIDFAIAAFREILLN